MFGILFNEDPLATEAKMPVVALGKWMQANIQPKENGDMFDGVRKFYITWTSNGHTYLTSYTSSEELNNVLYVQTGCYSSYKMHPFPYN